MSQLDDARAAAQKSLKSLRALMSTALAAPGNTDLTPLQQQIDDMTFKVNKLNHAAIAVDDARLATLNAQLDKVTQAATAAEADLGKLQTVLDDAAAAAKLIDTIAGIVTKIG
jgi:chromosome segregation ATPase